MPLALGGTIAWNNRARLFSLLLAEWWRRHFQKNSLMSGTFEPPEIYSSDLSYIATTVEPTNGLPLKSVSLIFTFAFSPGLYASADGFISTFNMRFSGGTTISLTSLFTRPSATATASIKKLGMSFFATATS